MQSYVIAILLGAVVLASAQYRQEETYSAPAQYQETYSAPDEKYEYPAQPYSFGYNVKDSESYNDFVHTEESDGKVTSGSYRVALPDGRIQIVTYRADAYGNVADVKYEGYARYPEYKAPSYEKPTYRAEY